MSTAVSRLQRVSEIMRVLVSQLSVLETMSPLSFLEFRDKLNPASGMRYNQWLRSRQRSLLFGHFWSPPCCPTLSTSRLSICTIPLTREFTWIKTISTYSIWETWIL